MTPEQAAQAAQQAQLRRAQQQQQAQAPCKRCVDGVITAALGQLQIGRKNVTDKDFGDKYDTLLLSMADLLKDAIMLEIKLGREQPPAPALEQPAQQAT